MSKLFRRNKKNQVTLDREWEERLSVLSEDCRNRFKAAWFEAMLARDEWLAQGGVLSDPSHVRYNHALDRAYDTYIAGVDELILKLSSYTVHM